MMKRIVQKFGGSLVVTIPANVARRLDIHEGDSVEVDEEAGGILIRPARLPRGARSGTLLVAMREACPFVFRSEAPPGVGPGGVLVIGALRSHQHSHLSKVRPVVEAPEMLLTAVTQPLRHS